MMDQDEIKLSVVFLVLMCILILLVEGNAENKTALNDSEHAASIEAEILEEKYESTE